MTSLDPVNAAISGYLPYEYRFPEGKKHSLSIPDIHDAYDSKTLT
jgi:hypothetical protein